MNIKKKIIAFVALFTLSNATTTAWYILTDSANHVSFQREEANYLGLLLNHLIFVSGFIFLLNKLIRINGTTLHSFVYGVVIAGIMFIPTGIVVRSIWMVDFNSIFLFNSIAHLVIGGILGITFHFIYYFKIEFETDDQTR